MLKLLLCSVILAPCFVIPFVGTANDVMADYDTTTFEDAYIEPELAKLKNCQNANLDVFFSEGYVEYHSAEYLSEGIKAASECGNVNYVLQPVEVSSSKNAFDKSVSDETNELILLLKAHGVSAKLMDPKVQKKYDSFIINGRSVILQIVIEGKDAV